MLFSLSSRSNHGKDAASPPRTSPSELSEKYDRPLAFWHINPHDRETLINHIMPCMAGSLRKESLLQTIVERHPWAEEFVGSEFTEVISSDSACFRETAAAFWMNPTTMTAALLRLTRLWFFVLLRYTYRKRFFEGREKCRSNLDIRDIDHDGHYIAKLADMEVYHLTRIPNRCGASYYRSSYKDARQRLGWRSFCERIRSFCGSLGLYTSTENPEKNIQELRHNLTSIMMRREWSRRLARNTVLIRTTKKDVKRIDERVTSGAVHGDEAIKETKLEVQEMSRRVEELQLMSPLLNQARQRSVELSNEFKNLRTACGKMTERLACRIQRSDETSKQLIQSLRSEVEELLKQFAYSNVREEGYITAEALVLCRWLLEHLPAARLTQESFSLRWKQFWRRQWDQCKKVRRASHPLWELVNDERFNRVGVKLYGTLSERLHHYGHQRGDELHADVQRVLDVIRPVHYDDNGKVDLEAERKRWTS
ncbi:hypothetical protein BDV96DRAFT_605343 [Lophiotrema nucula]|uniref:Uncharacterized protein n=1 Tax=Lophiotrema nucula TaxID=690887 RepID=A0A6A5YP73_9PLEO|nr:hypothetical protein BDV96DRAFT_605343 [Lophiotrema nucula]